MRDAASQTCLTGSESDVRDSGGVPGSAPSGDFWSRIRLWKAVAEEITRNRCLPARGPVGGGRTVFFAPGRGPVARGYQPEDPWEVRERLLLRQAEDPWPEDPWEVRGYTRSRSLTSHGSSGHGSSGWRTRSRSLTSHGSSGW